MLQQLDSLLEQLFAGWNIYSTLLCIGIVTYLIYPVFFTPEPDTHPFLLARQSSPSYVRQPGESAVYRSLETSHGIPLKSGLNVKDPGAPRWASGRDGDLRDIWKKALQGPTDDDGKSTGQPAKVLTVLGKEEVVEHKLEEVSKDINAIGQHLSQHSASRVALYLPNSLELLAALFGELPRANQLRSVLISMQLPLSTDLPRFLFLSSSRSKIWTKSCESPMQTPLLLQLALSHCKDS